MSTDPNFDIAGNGGYVRGAALYVNGVESAAPAGTQPYPVSLIVDDSAVTGTVYSNGGTWSGYAPIQQGIHAVAAVETINGQTYTTRTVTYDVVNSPPTIAFSADGVATNKAQQSLSGTVASAGGTAAVAGQTLTVSENGTQLGQTLVGQDGTWTMNVTLPQLGQNLLDATVSDAAGNIGYGGAEYLYETAPHAVAISEAGGLTNQPDQRVMGTATSQDVITLTDNGTVVGSTTANANGTWSIEAALTTQGANVLRAVDTSPAGNVGTSGTVTYTLDTLPPAVAITSPATSTRGASATETVTGTAEVGSTVALFDDGAPVAGTTAGADGTWSAAFALHPGPNGISAQATDAAGNVGYSNGVVDTLDTTPVPSATPSVASAPTPSATTPNAPSPAVAITSAGGLTNQPAATVSGQATANSAVTLYDGATPVAGTTAGADGSWTLALTLAQGLNTLSATDSTAAGTAGGNAIADILDTTPPSVGFGPAPQLAGTTATLTGTAADASGIKGVEIYDGTTDLGAAQVGGDGSWTFTHDFGQGSYDHLTAVATDAAGNSAAAAALFDLDTGITGRRYIGKVTTTDASGAVTGVTTTAADGSTGSQTIRNPDGTATSAAFENGQALFSIGSDVMTGGGMRENFVFQPTMGHARITDFVVDGRGHDTLTLSHADFANVAQVLARTTMSNGSAVIHVSPDDTIRLAGVTKAQLAANKGDFAFTA